MNGPFVVAQANTGGSSGTPVQVLKLIKPPAGQTDIMHATFAGTVKIDFTAIANEKITLYHDSKNQSLHVIFADGSQIVIEPFFDSRGTVLGNLTFEMGPNLFYSGEQFAQNVPITEDASVLPAAGGTSAAGADFHGFSVDGLFGGDPLALLPPEELPGLQFTNTGTPVLEQGTLPNLVPGFGAPVLGIVEEESVPANLPQSDAGPGNEDTLDAAGNDKDVPGNLDNTTNKVLNGSLAGLVVGGDLPITFNANSAADHHAVVDNHGNPVTSLGSQVYYVFVSATQIEGWTFNGDPASGGTQNLHVFTLEVAPNGAYTFTLTDQVDHPVHSFDDGTNPAGIFEETLNLDLSTAITAHDATPDTVVFPPNSFDIGVIDDTPTLGCLNEDQGGDEGGDQQTQFAGNRHPGEGGNALITGLGGSAGFGEQSLPANDDGSSSFVDVTSIFPAGMNFFGTAYNGFYINNNGNITFGDSLGTYTPFALTGATGLPIIAPFFADVDTRGAGGNTSPGGTSSGSNLVYWDFDATNGVITITWDDVGYYSAHNNLVNAFQLVIYNTGGQNFAFEFRYENIDWTTGDASGGSNGLGGVVTRAGWNSGNGTDFFELPQSGDQAAILALETTSNPGTAQDGNWVFNVVGGQVTGDHCITTVAVDEDDLNQFDIGTSTYQGNNDVAQGDDLPAPSPVSATGDLGVLYGTDGPGELIGVQYTGPALTSQGKPVVFVEEGGVWYGRVLDNDPTTAGDQPRDVFKFEVNFGAQTFTFTLLDNLDHPLTDDPSTPATETSFEDNLLLQFGVTVTDFDGDAIVTTVSVNVDDDSPTVAVALAPAQEGEGNTELAGLVLDESIGGDTGIDNDGDGANDDNPPVTVPSYLAAVDPSLAIGITSTPSNSDPGTSVSDLFTVTKSVGADGLLDEQKSYTLTLTDENGDPVLAGSETGVLTNLHVTNTDGSPVEGDAAHRAVWLFKVSDTEIVGLVGQDTVGDQTDDFVALHIFLNIADPTDPILTVEQYLPLEHPLTGTDHFDEAIFLNFAGGEGGDQASLSITLSDTVTDGDGDTSTDSESVLVASVGDSESQPGTSLITFEDDGPSLNIVDAPNAVNETQVINGTWALAEGTDGVSSVDVTIGGITKTLSIPSGVLGVDPLTSVTFTAGEGAFGTLQVFSDGTWTYTADSISGGDKAFTFTVKAVDGDGDQASDSQTITIHDVSTPLTNADLTGTVEEEQLQPSSGTYPITASGNEDIDDLSGNDTDISPAGFNNVTNVATGTLNVSGGDGTYVYNLAGGIEGTQVQKVGGGGLTSEGAAVLYHQVSPGHFIGYVNEGVGGIGFDGGDRVVFSLDFTSNTGDYTFTLYDNVDHPTPTSGGPATEETLAINLNSAIVVDDEAGQTALVQGSINIIDDVPLVNVGLNTEFNSSHVALELDETVQPDGANNPAFDTYNTGESESAPTGGSNGGVDDVASAPNVYSHVPVVSTAPTANQAIGHKETAPGLLDDFFTGFLTPQFGADGPAAIDPTSLSLKFSLAAPTLTNLFATDTGDPLLTALSDGQRAIYLVKISDTVVEGHLAGVDGPGGLVTGDEYVAFRLTLNDTGDPSTSTILVDQFLAIDHDLSDSSVPAVETPSVFDENVVMKLVGGGSLGLELDVTAKDGDGDTAVSSTTATLADSSGSFLSFDDDGPAAVARTATVGETQTVASDVVLIIDTSGSMGPAGNGNAGSDPDGAGPFNSRLEMVKAAVQELFNSGAVHSVFIVDFNSTATFHSGPVGGWFTDLASAMAVIDALSDSNNTDYDSALQAVTANFTAPPPGGDRLVSMFLSDGIPNEDNGTGSIGIDEDDTDGNPAAGGEETDWINFLTANGFDASYALGFGGLSDANKAALEPIAWTPGETADNPYDADAASGANDPKVLIVNDLSTINGLVSALITSVGGSTAGNVITNATVTTADDANLGTDGHGFVGELRYDSNGDGVVNGADVQGYTFNGSHLFLNGVDQGAVSEVTFTPNGHGGSMHFNFLTGAWDYTAPNSIGATFIDRFTFTLVDGDNDATAATALDITVPGNEAPVAGDDIIIKNAVAGAFSVPEWAFLLNDTDPNGNPIDITGVSGASDVTVSHTAGSGTNGTISITDTSFPGGSFNYTVSDGSLDDLGSVTVINDNGDITGTSAGEIIVGDTNSSTYDGAGGNDAIFAADGNDTLIGGAGDDWLTGGTGNDNFVLSGLSVAANGHDTILDFVSGTDDIFVDVASQALTIGTAAAVNPADFHTGDETNAATWNGGSGSGTGEFVWNNTTKELWYSANGTGSDKIDLAHVSTGVPAAADVHTF